MYRSVCCAVAVFLFTPYVFAGQTGYTWFDAKTCERYAVSTDVSPLDDAHDCMRHYHETYADGRVSSFSFGNHSSCGALAGATYKLLKFSGPHVPAFQCIAGCRKSTPRLLEEALEESSGDEISHPKIEKKFQVFKRRCKNQ